jgi:hypothetical protein
MTRGRHRQSSSVRTTLPLVAVGALAVSGAALAILTSDTRLLRLGVSCSLAATVSVAALMRVRERDQIRELAVETSARRRDEAVFQEQLQGLRGVIDKLAAQVVDLREELAEVTAAHSAAVLLNTAPWRPAALTSEAFLTAAAALTAGPETAEESEVGSGAESAVEEPVAQEVPDEAAAGEPEPRPAGSLPHELRPVPLETASWSWFGVQRSDDDLAETAAAEDQTTDAEAEVAEVEAVDAEDDEEREAEPAVAAEARRLIDLTAHDDTQPLRLAGVRKQA